MKKMGMPPNLTQDFRLQSCQAILERPLWETVRIWSGLIVGGVAFALVALAVMYGRAGTLRSVRNLDQELLVHLISATASSPVNEKRLANLHEALNHFVPPGQKDAYLGAAVWEENSQLVANHQRLRGRSWEEIQKLSEGDSRFEIQAVGRGAEGKEWRLGTFRSEKGFSDQPWLFFLSPLEQWISPDSLDVTWKSIQRRALGPGGVAGIGVMAVFLFLNWTVIKQKKEVARKEIENHCCPRTDRNLSAPHF